MLMTDYRAAEIEEPTVPESRAAILGPKCKRCKCDTVAAPIPSPTGRLCVDCFLRPSKLPFIVERLARKEANRAIA